MSSKKTKTLVIDTDIAQSAGKTDHPRSSTCGHVLKRTREICHRIAMSRAVYEEWKKHASVFSMKWLASMRSKGKMKYVPVKPVHRQDIVDHVNGSTLSKNKKKAVLKDLHLIEAAGEADRVILSMDNKARDLFAGLTEEIPDIADMTWVNPMEMEKLDYWLERGYALNAKKYHLEAYK